MQAFTTHEVKTRFGKFLDRVQRESAQVSRHDWLRKIARGQRMVAATAAPRAQKLREIQLQRFVEKHLARKSQLQFANVRGQRHSAPVSLAQAIKIQTTIETETAQLARVWVWVGFAPADTNSIATPVGTSAQRAPPTHGKARLALYVHGGTATGVLESPTTVSMHTAEIDLDRLLGSITELRQKLQMRHVEYPAATEALFSLIFRDSYQRIDATHSKVAL